MPRNDHLSGMPCDRPAAHLLEGRPDNADQMTVVLAAQIGLDLRGNTSSGSRSDPSELHPTSRGTPDRCRAAPQERAGRRRCFRPALQRAYLPLPSRTCRPASSPLVRRHSATTSADRPAPRSAYRAARAPADIRPAPARDPPTRPSSILEARRPDRHVRRIARRHDVDAETEHDVPDTRTSAVVELASARMPATFRVPRINIVRPLQSSADPLPPGCLRPTATPAAIVSIGDTAGGTQHDGHVQAGAGRRRPRAAVAAAASRAARWRRRRAFGAPRSARTAATSLVETTRSDTR